MDLFVWRTDGEAWMDWRDTKEWSALATLRLPGWPCSSSGAQETVRYEVRAAWGGTFNGVLQVVMRETWRDFIGPLTNEQLFVS